jgi:hypothetical protein
MLALLISWVLTGALSLVFGLAACKLLASRLPDEKYYVPRLGADYVILFGFLLITALAAIVSLFSPINGYVTAAFTLAGAGLAFQEREELKQILQSIRAGWRAMSGPLKAALIAVFLLAMCSVIIEFGESDVWFYHAQSIQWIKKYAVVPGLGNLHGRFAFNSHFFISNALFTLWFSEDYVVFPVLSLFFFLCSARLLVNMQTALAAQKPVPFILNAVLVLAFTFHTFPEILGTSTDVISTIFLIYAFLLFLNPSFTRATTSVLLLFWMLILTAVTFKLSAVFAAVILLFTLPQVFRSKKTALFFAASLLIFVPFVIRNVVLSGYLFYPVPEIDLLSVDWKIPLKEVIFEKELVEGWSKIPPGSPDMAIEDIPNMISIPFGTWFGQWWPAMSIKWRVIMAMDLFVLVLLVAALYRKNYSLAALAFTIVLNMVFWFLKAPNPRFGFAFLFMGAGLVLAYGLAPVIKRIKLGNYIFSIFCLLILSFVKLKSGVSYTEDLRPSLLLIPHYYQPKSALETFKTKNFTVYTPPAAPPARGIWCYNLPLPCTPFPKENLVMRGQSYQSGFRILKEPEQ